MSISVDGLHSSPGAAAASARLPVAPASQLLSTSGKIWQLPIPSDGQSDSRSGQPNYRDLLEATLGSETLAKLLLARGISTAAAAYAFLDPSRYQSTDPMELPDVDKAIVRISQAIAEKQQITVYGDYDVDGVTATSLLLTVLRNLGASVDFYIPNRSNEGYGLNLKAVSILASKHRTKLIITCDCGVSNFAEINFAKSLGVDTLVLDHHSMPEILPPAVGIVHPKRLSPEHPLFDLPGVGVAFKVCEAILIDRQMLDQIEPLLDFVTLGMIADLVPLIRENRYLVQIGLPKLVNSPRPGIQALLGQVRKSGDTDVVGFGLAPRINAVGRLADAKIAVELMTTDDPQVADALAKQLQLENARRQDLCERIFAEADQMVQSKIDLAKEKAIAIYAEGWHHGVVGIVASRLVEKYHRPVFIGELDTAEGTIRGSARSIEGFDLYEALKLNDALLSRWGGHKMAAGFTIEAEKGESFVAAINQTCNKLLSEDSLQSVIKIDAVIEPQDLTFDLARLVTKLAPFGMANKKPLFFSNDFRLVGSRLLGRDGKHHKLMLKSADSETYLEAVFWNSRGRIPKQNQRLSLVFSLEINAFNGHERLQLVLSDWLSEEEIEETYQIGDENVKVQTTPAVATIETPQATPAVAAISTIGKALDCSPADSPVLSSTPSAKADFARIVWKDLRGHAQPNEILVRASEKLANDLAIFSESPLTIPGVTVVDRTGLTSVAHLIFSQFPPSAKIFQEIVTLTKASTIYLIGRTESDTENTTDEPAAFLKRLAGLVKFAVKQKEGQVEGDKLAALMASTKMSLALGLTILRKINLIDWFAEDGRIFLDIIGEPVGIADDLPEFRQLANSLMAVREFRTWCQSSNLKDIQLGLAPDLHDSLPPDSPKPQGAAYQPNIIHPARD